MDTEIPGIMKAVRAFISIPLLYPIAGPIVNPYSEADLMTERALNFGPNSHGTDAGLSTISSVEVPHFFVVICHGNGGMSYTTSVSK